MGKTKQNQSIDPNGTAALTMEDQTLSTNLTATAIPLGIGECKTTICWFTPIYGLTATKAKSGGKGGK